MKARLHLGILRGAATFVPAVLREEWLAEWKAELWYVEQHDLQNRTHRSLGFCLGAFIDAAWLAADLGRSRKESAVCCVVTLAFAALACVASALFLPGALNVLPQNSSQLLAHIFVLCLAMWLVRIGVHLSGYPSTSLVPRTTTLAVWWSFLGVKLILAAVIVFFGVIVLAHATNTPIQPHGWLVGYVLGFRWAFRDQRKRCPECLEILGLPARIGSNAQIFLEWHGTELMCRRGHGLLHMPEVRMSYCTDRWLRLDGTWATLFTTHRGSIR